MSNWPVVLLKIAAMFLVILVGWIARRRAYLTAETTSTLSRLVVDVTMPALIFTQMLRTVNPEELLGGWYLPLLGGLVIIIGHGVGLLTAPLFSRRDQRSTFIFLIAIANWVYLPLPIIQALYGDSGVRELLIANVGSQLVLWTLGVWTLRGGKPDLSSLRNVATNPGLLATAAGIILAILAPGTRTLETLDVTTASPLLQSASAVIQALVMVGSLTIPLSLVVTGAQLGGLDLSEHGPSRTLSGVLIARLAIVPVITIALTVIVARFGIMLPEVSRMVAYIIACMPTAVSCSIFTERFGGDTPLAARAIFYSTLFSIATVPVCYYLIRRFGW